MKSTTLIDKVLEGKSVTKAVDEATIPGQRGSQMAVGPINFVTNGDHCYGEFNFGIPASVDKKHVADVLNRVSGISWFSKKFSSPSKKNYDLSITQLLSTATGPAIKKDKILQATKDAQKKLILALSNNLGPVEVLDI